MYLLIQVPMEPEP